MLIGIHNNQRHTLKLMNLKKKWSEAFDGDYVKANIAMTEAQLKEEKNEDFPLLIEY